MGRGMLREGGCCGQGVLQAGGHDNNGEAVGMEVPLHGDGAGRGMPWPGLPTWGTSGFPPAGDLADGARGHDVALRRQADQGHALVQHGWPAEGQGV